MSEKEDKPFRLNPVEDLEIGDCRIDNVFRLGVDIPATYLGGPSHKAGDPAFSTTNIVDRNGERTGFTVPNSTAMALSIAWRAAGRARTLIDSVKYKNVQTPDGPGKVVEDDFTTTLFDYFEQCMVAVTFSFQALEVYSNQIISSLENDEKISLVRKGNPVSMTPAEFERNASTSEKIAVILPQIMDISTPKGGVHWEHFVKLKRARDSTIHMKSADQYPENNDTLFYEYLAKDVADYPNSAAKLIAYFCQKGAPRWIKAVDHRNKKTKIQN